MNRVRRSSAIVALGLLVAASGCSNEARVSGSVKLDGKRLDTGVVSFHPVGEGPIAIGQIDDSGDYTAAVGSGGGFAPGDYIVTVVANEPMIPAKDPRMAPMPGKLITPQMYASKERSDLKCTLKAGSNTYDIAITSK